MIDYDYDESTLSATIQNTIDYIIQPFSPNTTTIKIKNSPSAILLALKVSCCRDHLSFITQIQAYKLLQPETEAIIGLIFAEVNKNTSKYLQHEKNNFQFTVVRFVVEHVTMFDINRQKDGFKMPHALNFMKGHPGWLINSSHSVACFGRVDVLLECKFTTKEGETYTKEYTIWVQSDITIDHLRYEVLISGLFDNYEFTVGDFFTKTEESFPPETKISDIITEFTTNPDLICLIAPDDSILM